MNNVELARTVLHALGSGDTATLTSKVTDDFQFIGITPQPLNKQEFLGFSQMLHAAFPDCTFHEVSASENGDTVTIKHTISGTHTGTLNAPGLPPIPATGKSFALPEESSVYTIKGDKVAQTHAYPAPDGGLTGILKQLGVQLPG